MTRCLYSGDELNEFSDVRFVSPDGDAVLTRHMKSYKKDKEKFLNETIHDDKKFDSWVKGEDK